MKAKIIGSFKWLFLLGAIVILSSACSHGTADEPEPVVPETPNEGNEFISSDTVLVSFVPQSLEWGLSPMSRASSDDLYGIIVYQSNVEINSENGFSSNAQQCALAIFDDINLLSIKLSKNQFYHFGMVYIPNGKNILEPIGDGWGTPFTLDNYPEYIPQLNTVVYKALPNHVGFFDVPSQVKGIKSTLAGANVFNEVLRYMGIYRNYKPISDNQKVTIELYRWQYGIKIIASDFYEGSVKCMTYYTNNEMELIMHANSSGVSTMEYNLECPTWLAAQTMFEYDNLDECATALANNNGFGHSLRIVYVTPNNEEIMLWSRSGSPFKRMKMHTLEFSLSDAIANGGISTELMDSSDETMEEINWDL